MAIENYYCSSSQTSAESDYFNVMELGIREEMLPGFVHHGGKNYPYLLMYFHTPCFVEKTPAEGKFILWSPQMLHRYGNPDRKWCHSWAILRGEAMNKLMAETPIPLNYLLDVSRATGDKMVFYLKMLWEELTNNIPVDLDMQVGILRLLFRELSRSLPQAEGRPGHRDTVIVAAARIMHNSLSHPPTLAELAENAHLSIPRFVVRFKQCYRIPPMQYMMQLRLERAMRLLSYWNLSVKQVAEEVGFEDPLYFSKVFRRLYGKSPKHFRHIS
ncbi:MAG: AraC family transcriptional regulator [Victivallaceae bacterium]|nr:AraC family transcriptional regulator [Victivallaceae bacterium]